MPRISVLQFTKGHQEVVAAFQEMLTNATITAREEQGRAVTDIEGDFSHFVLEDMELWEPHLKIEVKDNAIKDEDDREARSFFAAAEPGFGGVLFSPTIAFVYQRVETRTRTKTITERLEDGKVTNTQEETAESEPVFTWKEITREFGRKVRSGRVPGWE